jgi:hypothetical protein
MPRRHPDRDPDGFWPSCDDQQPGVSIRPLNHADMASLLAHLGHHPDPSDTVRSGGPAPVLAMRVRASVGRPGASAHAQYRRRRTTELAVWTRSLPWRTGAVLAVGLVAWLLATQVAAHLAALAGVTVAAGLAWRLRFRVTPDTMAWRRGAAGERRTARLLGSLERRGWAVLHDLAIPGTQANIDSSGDWSGRGGGDRHQVVPGTAAAGPRRAVVARPPPPPGHLAESAVGGRPGRRGPRRGRRPGRRHHGRARRQGSLGTADG